MSTAVKTEEGADSAVQYYSKPGQRFPTPSPGSGDRVFYETLFHEKPTSEMALIWLIEHGVFSKEQAEALFEAYVVARNKARAQTLAASEEEDRKAAASGGGGAGGGGGGGRKTVMDHSMHVGFDGAGTEGVGRTTL